MRVHPFGNASNSVDRGRDIIGVGPVARSDKGGVDLISDVLPFGRLWYAEPDAINNAVGYTKFYSRSHDAVIRVYDDAGNVIETHEHAGDFRSPCSTRRDLWRGKAMAETPIFAMKKTSKAEFYAIEAGSKLMNGNARETNRTPNAWRMEALRYLREGLGASVAAKRERSKKKIAQFAKKYGFRLRFYSKGMCALFDKWPPPDGK